MAAHMHLQHGLLGVPARASHGAGSDSRSVVLQAAPRSCHAPCSAWVSGTLGERWTPAHMRRPRRPCAARAGRAAGAPRRRRRADGAALTAPRARRRTTRACGTCTATPTGTCTWARRSIFGGRRAHRAAARRLPRLPRRVHVQLCRLGARDRAAAVWRVRLPGAQVGARGAARGRVKPP